MGDTSTKSEINHFNDSFSFIKQNVFQLYVSVCNIPLVTVVNSLDYLSPQIFCLKFRHLPIWLHFQISMQTSSVDVFHENKDLLMRFKGLVEFRNIRMIKLFHDFHFSFNRFASIRFKKFNFFINLYSDLLIKKFVQAKPYNCVSSLAYTFTNNVVIKIFNSTSRRAEL